MRTRHSVCSDTVVRLCDDRSEPSQHSEAQSLEPCDQMLFALDDIGSLPPPNEKSSLVIALVQSSPAQTGRHGASDLQNTNKITISESPA